MTGIAIVDYGSGNLRSVAKAFERARTEAGSVTPIFVTAEPERIARAERVVLPGVGAFADCLRGINAVDGLREALEESVIARGRPFLGICVGMQLMAARGLEHGTHLGFGWISGDIGPMAIDDPTLKIPHMGWNLIENRRPHPVLDLCPDPAHAYFVHSYALQNADPETVLATMHHGRTYPAMVGRDNMIGTQFHPEKSQGFGLKLIAEFLQWSPRAS